jgi:SAM-dependent methyltransferase
MRRLARERSKLFDEAADVYDRARPRYPEPLLDELLGREPAALEVLDVGCGTGIASRQIAARGATVTGVEPGARMAEVARSHRIEVEVSSFEAWDPAGRTFDLVVAAQAWHWLDLDIATPKAASLLRPGGQLGLIWNSGYPTGDLADALREVYGRVIPDGTHRMFRGYAADDAEDARSGLDAELAAISATAGLSDPSTRWFPWRRTYQRDEWLGQLMSRSDHTALDPVVLDALLQSIGRAIDDQGGSFEMTFDSCLITATCR